MFNGRENQFTASFTESVDQSANPPAVDESKPMHEISCEKSQANIATVLSKSQMKRLKRKQKKGKDAVPSETSSQCDSESGL
jgi:hypothetical protein